MVFRALLFSLSLSTCLVAQETDQIAIRSWAAPLYWQQSIESPDPAKSAKSNVRDTTNVLTSTLVFVGIAPCRLVDKRDGTLPVPFGPPTMAAAWPTPNRPSPDVSILNSSTGTVIANAVVVPAGTSGSIDVFVTNVADLVIDINGYYVPLSSTLLNGTAAVPVAVEAQLHGH